MTIVMVGRRHSGEKSCKHTVVKSHLSLQSEPGPRLTATVERGHPAQSPDANDDDADDGDCDDNVMSMTM